ncbi:deoxynucleotide monophosphate kinase [Pseudomonas viridiflava]|uniref:deoxynucleotide monophosphate kinase family protein n=2 Tax=Pseudomonas viridiflava TaxID=33069 RepID=UPI001F11D6AB|nr:deoxynucleotide monophosphate kinase [Pseudomonas viridiflava]
MRTIIGLAALARSGKDTVASMLLAHPKVAAFALADPLKVGCQALFGLTDSETWDDTLKEQKISLWGKSPREFFQRVGTEWMRHHNPEHWLMRAEREINRSSSSISCAEQIPQEAGADAPFILAARAFFDFTVDQLSTSGELNTYDAAWGLSPQEAIGLLKRYAYEMLPDYDQLRSQRPLEALKPRGQVPHNAEVIIIKDIRFENEAAFLRRHNGKIWHIKRQDLQKVNAHSSEHGILQAPEDILILNDGSLDELRQKVAAAWKAHGASLQSHLVAGEEPVAPEPKNGKA